MPAHSAKFTSRIGDGQGDHEGAYHDTINLLIALNRSGSMIDIGCGMGRNTVTAAQQMREVVALEPDVDRFNWSRDQASPFPNATVLNTVSGDYIEQNPGKQFDLVLLGMVVQHLSTHTCRRVLADVATLTKTGGVAVVSTTHALERARYFTYQKAEKAREHAAISEEEFNRYADNSQMQDKGLPVRRFSRSEPE